MLDDPFEAVHNLLPELQLEPPFDFLEPDPQCRGTFGHPEPALRKLRADCGPPALLDRGIVRRRSDGQLELDPSLINPCGATVALRPAAGAPPNALLAARGLLGTEASPVWTALSDVHTASAVAGCGVLLVTNAVREVVLLRALGLPATLGRFRRLTARALRRLDAQFSPVEPAGPPDLSTPESAVPGAFRAAEHNSEGDDRPANLSAAASPPPGEPLAHAPPVLLLVGWRPARRDRSLPGWVARLADQLVEVRRRLGLDLTGVAVWRPAQALIDHLDYRAGWRDVDAVRELMLESLAQTCELEDLVVAGPARRTRLGLFAAEQAVIAALAGPRMLEEPDAADLDLAYARYCRVVERRLLRPLIAQSSRSGNATARNVYFQLAQIARLLHRASPMVQALQLRQLRSSDELTVGLPSEETIKSYLALADRFGALVKALGSLFPRG